MAAPTIPDAKTLIEGFHGTAFLIGENYSALGSREPITVLAGRNLLNGTVLGKVLMGTTAVAAALGTNVGNGTFGAIAVNGVAAQPGAYTVTFLAATLFVVADPLGNQIGDGATGVAFSGGGLGFTITAGGTPFQAGDSFSVTPAAGSGKYVAFDPTAFDGSQYPVGILYLDARALAADVQAVAYVRDVVVNANRLVWGPNVTTTPQKTAALAAMAASAKILNRT